MLTRQRLRNWLYALGVIAIFLAFIPFYSYDIGITPTPAQTADLDKNPAAMLTRTEISFGWPSSRLIEYRSESTRTDDNGRISVHRTINTTIGWFTWSSLSLAFGVVLIRLAWRLKPAKVK